MKLIRTIFVGLCISLSFLNDLFAVEAAGFDVITTKSGDVHNGNIDQVNFTLQSSYGLLTIPYDFVQEIMTGDGKKPDQVKTRFGDLFKGRIQEQEITILRVLDPPLSVSVTDIADIKFSPKESRLKLLSALDTIYTMSGDLYSARISTTDFMLKSPGGVKLLNRKELFLLDFMRLEDEEEVMVQATLENGAVIQGELLTQRIRAVDRYGNAVDIPLKSLSSLAFYVNHQKESAPQNNYRTQVPAYALIRDRMRDGTLGPEMRILRSGTYQRGDLQGNGDTDEKPPVTISVKPFAIGMYEVTFDEFDRFCESTGRDKPEDEGWGRGQRPVINVSWNSAVAYAQWLSQQTGEQYRLPTDAEWEYAARAGTSSRYWWGSEIDGIRANCAECGSLWDGEMSSEVGRFRPNPFGLHDTAGNVFEWVADCWNDTYENAPKDGSALEKKDCGVRVIRGGAWSFPPKEIRSANRWRDFQPRQSDDTGFRLVRVLSRTE